MRTTAHRCATRLALVVAIACLGGAAPTYALNKQGARSGSEPDDPPFNLAGYVFGGVFLFNPSYAARPNNTGNVLLRYGLHIDADLYHRWLSISYDLNVFTDRSEGARSPIAPTEHDHIVGLLSTLSLPRHLELTFAVHYETDQPGYEARGRLRATRPDCGAGRPPPPRCYDVGYSQSYVDAYARLSYTRGILALSAALGGFLWNNTYAARPDNSGLALLRYVLHGELTLRKWLVLRLDLNFFTDREDKYVVPTELDLTSELAVRLRAFELRFVGEMDLPLGNYPGGAHPAAVAGVKQAYLALLGQWSFDLQKIK